ncbi:MAG: stalk domain-containing protein, partial [Clostridia bacterium]
MKKIIAFITAVLMTLSAFGFDAGAEGINSVDIDGVKVEFEDAFPSGSGDTAMIPLRFVTEGMGLEFNWYPARQQVEITSDNLKAVITVGSKTVEYVLDEEEYTFNMKKAAVLENNRMLCSKDCIELFAGIAGYNVLKEDVDGCMVITSASAAKAVVGGKTVVYSGCGPAIVDGGTMFPVRFVAEAMGLSFVWYPSLGKA